MASTSFKTFTISFTSLAILLHIAFIVFTFFNRKIDCVDRLDPVSAEFELFIVWSITYFPLILLCIFYTLLFRMCRSCICSCHACCGNDKNGKTATKCKICFEGIFGNPLIFVIIYILWGIFEWTSFGNDCSLEIEYGFLADLILSSLSLIILCIYYFKSVQHRFNEKMNENIAKKYNHQQQENKKMAKQKAIGKGPEFDEGSAQPAPYQPDRRFSAHSLPRNQHNPNAPNYAHSAHGIPAYQMQGGMYTLNVYAKSQCIHDRSPTFVSSATTKTSWILQSKSERPSVCGICSWNCTI